MSSNIAGMETRRDAASDSTSISILNQYIDDEDGIYRIQYESKVGYLSMRADVFDEDTMSRPYLLIPQLRKLPEISHRQWTRMHILRNAPNGGLERTYTNDPLPAISNTWHAEYIDVLALTQTKYYGSRVHEVLYKDKPAISKIAAFEWEIPRIEHETWAYSIIDRHQQGDCETRDIAPKFLGHLTENGRVIGMLLERIDGSSPSIENLQGCKDTLHILHRMGLVHGDVNRYNFLVDRESGMIKIVDFEYVKDFDEMSAGLELDSLALELSEETGRGQPTVLTC